MRPHTPVSYELALSRAATLCDRCEQCTPDLMAKLLKWGLAATDASRVIDKLVELEYVDDSRFARAYAHDKLRFSGWGRRKIRMGLWAKRIPRELIDAAVESLDDDEYGEVMERILRARLRLMDAASIDFEYRVKLIRHMAQRGFETSQALKALDRVIRDEKVDE